MWKPWEDIFLEKGWYQRHLDPITCTGMGTGSIDFNNEYTISANPQVTCSSKNHSCIDSTLHISYKSQRNGWVSTSKTHRSLLKHCYTYYTFIVGLYDWSVSEISPSKVGYFLNVLFCKRRLASCKALVRNATYWQRHRLHDDKLKRNGGSESICNFNYTSCQTHVSNHKNNNTKLIYDMDSIILITLMDMCRSGDLLIEDMKLT